MPSRIFFTSASVAAKMRCTFAVTSARFVSSFDLALPLSATSLARAAPFGPCMPVTPGRRLGGRLGLALLEDPLLLLAELPGRGVGVRGRGLLVGEALLELRLVGLRQLLLGDPALRHLLVGLVLARLEVDLLGRCRFGHGARRRDRDGLAGLLLRHRGDRLGDRLRLVGRRRGRRLDVLGLAVLALGRPGP